MNDRDLDDLAAILDRPRHDGQSDPAPVPTNWRDHVTLPSHLPEPPVRSWDLVWLHAPGVAGFIAGLAACACVARLAGWL